VAARKPPGRGRALRTPRVDPARSAALLLLTELDAEGIPAGGRMEQLEGTLTRADERRFFHALVQETLRHRLRLDHRLAAALTGRTLEELPAAIRNVLRLGACQLLLLEGIPAHAAVDTSVSLARRHGHAGTAALVNAVLRRLAREPAKRALDPAAPAPPLAVRFSHPSWLVQRWLDRFGLERTERILAFNLEQPDYWLRLRPGAAPPPGAAPGWIPGTARLPAGSRPAEHAGFAEGEWSIQDGSGILVGALAPEVRGLVVDLCAAPGTKTGHLAERALAGTRILACDLSVGRCRRMRRGRRRLEAGASAGAVAPGVGSVAGGVTVETVCADGRRLPLRAPWDGALLDAPCSNLGVLRRRVDLKWRARASEISRLAAIQSALLQSAAAGLAPGGWLVYSVCTTEPEETLAQRDLFLERQTDFHPYPLPDWIPEAARGRSGEMILIPGELETDGGYAFVVRRNGA